MEEKEKNVKLLEKVLADTVKENYQKMYHSLFTGITKAIEVLKVEGDSGIETALQILIEAQCKTEDIYVSTEHTDNIYADMIDRLNLQALGYFIKEGSTLIKRKTTNFIEREKIAEMELEKELQKLQKSERDYDIFPAIMQYSAVREEVQFSLGMKVGAKLALMLTLDYETDF